jgi:hypothetical protein
MGVGEAYCNQNTMSRRVKQTQAAFILKLQCIAGAWEPGGDSQLLQLERQLQQRRRFSSPTA